jgi:trypsin-like peptidase
LAGIQTLREVEQLCPDEEFAEQPSAAFCSAVLVAQGLILTSRHCLAATEIHHMRLVFGYYLESRERLALTAQDVYELTSIVAVSDEGVDGVDCAWRRFANATAKERLPAPVISSLSRGVEPQPLIALSAGSGIPLKLDARGSVIDARQGSQDYFLSDIAFRGASGSGVFSADGALLGIVVSGNADFVRNEKGCRKRSEFRMRRGKKRSRTRVVQSLAYVRLNQTMRRAQSIMIHRATITASQVAGCSLLARPSVDA